MLAVGNKPIVSSLSMAFKKATQITENQEEAKKEHRQSLKTLMDKYMEDVAQGKAEGIRNAKDLVEIMKMDLLLMGEVTERVDNSNDYDEVRVQKITQVLDINETSIRQAMTDMLTTLNDLNDSEDTGTNRKVGTEATEDNKGKSIMVDDDALAEIAQQALQDHIDSQETPDKSEEE